MWNSIKVEGIHGLSKAVCKVYMLLQMVQALVLFHADHQWRDRGACQDFNEDSEEEPSGYSPFFFLISQVVILLNPERQYIGRGEVAVAN